MRTIPGMVVINPSDDVEAKAAVKAAFDSVSAAAAAVVIISILPNTSSSVAYAMSRIPVLSKWVDVVTFRDYQFESLDLCQESLQFLPVLNLQNISVLRSYGLRRLTMQAPVLSQYPHKNLPSAFPLPFFPLVFV